MGEKKAGVFIVSLFLMVFLLGVISAAPVGNCGIIERASCPANNIVMGLSGMTNAHGEYETTVTPGTYPYVLCCNFGNGVQSGECSEGTKILGLSSATNAHAENKSLNNYGTDICYRHSLICTTGGATNPNVGLYIDAILSLSGTTGTNAHIGGPDDYTTKIWCNVVVGTYCGDGVVQQPNEQEFVEECDSADPADNCLADCICEIGYVGTGLGDCEWAGSAMAYWSPDEVGGSQKDHLDVYVGSTFIYMFFKDIYKPSQEFTFKIYEKDWLGNDLIRTETGTTETGGEVAVNWTISQSDIDATGEDDPDDFYFKVYDSLGDYIGKSNDMSITIYESPPCRLISLCLDYRTQERCEKDKYNCNVSTLSVELISPITCGGDIICECWWEGEPETGECNSRWGDGTGWCEYNETIQDKCTEENLFLTYIITANWDNSGEELLPNCVGGSNAVPCPAQIKLPFFNIYNLIAIIVVIILIYFLLNLKKKKRKVSKKKK